MNKKILSFGLAIMILLSGCGNGSEKSKKANLQDDSLVSETEKETSSLKTARSYTKSKDYSKAITEYKKYLDENPYDMDGWLGLSETYLKNGDDYGIKMFDDWDDDYLSKFSDKEISLYHNYLRYADKTYPDLVSSNDDNDNDDDTGYSQSTKYTLANQQAHDLYIIFSSVIAKMSAYGYTPKNVYIIGSDKTISDVTNTKTYDLSTFLGSDYKGYAIVVIDTENNTVKFANWSETEITSPIEFSDMNDQTKKEQVVGIYPYQTLDTDFSGTSNAGTSSNAGASNNPGASSNAGTTGTSQSEKTLVIYTWNKEFKDVFEKYYLPNNPLPDGYTYDIVINTSPDNVYQNKLDEALAKQSSNNTKVDIFLTEPDYIMKYINSDFTKDLKSLGITDADLANQYPYTKAIGTSDGGVLKALTWQAAPGTFAYRRSIAKETLGTDKPEDVAALISDWDKFEATAAKVCKSGKYKMLAGVDDAYRLYTQNKTTPWVNANNTINIDSSLKKWAEQTKRFTDKGYNTNCTMWSTSWTDMDNNTFGYFFPTWAINYTLPIQAEDTVGDWACCTPTKNYYWGGSFLCAAEGGDNDELVAKVMKSFTTDNAGLETYSKENKDFVNNIKANENINKSFVATAEVPTFYGGQNFYNILDTVGKNITVQNTTSYDYELDNKFMYSMNNYFIGISTYDQAVQSFYASAVEKFPELNIPAK